MNDVQTQLAPLLAKPSSTKFGELIDALLALPQGECRAHLGWVEDQVRTWPSHIPRHVSADQAEVVRAEALPLFRLTHPLDLTIVDADTQKAAPADFGDGEDTLLAFSEHLTSLGVRAVDVELTPEQLATFFPPNRNVVEYANYHFHHGSLSVRGEAEFYGERFVVITGDLRSDTSLRLVEMHGLGVGGDVSAPSVLLDCNALVLGTVRAQHAVLAPSQFAADLNRIEGDFVLAHIARFQQVEACVGIQLERAKTMVGAPGELLLSKLTANIKKDVEHMLEETSSPYASLYDWAAYSSEQFNNRNRNRGLSREYRSLRDLLIDGTEPVWIGSSSPPDHTA